MPQMPIRWAEPEPKRPPLRPWLWLALTLVVLAFCTTLLVR